MPSELDTGIRRYDGDFKLHLTASIINTGGFNFGLASKRGSKQTTWRFLLMARIQHVAQPRPSWIRMCRLTSADFLVLIATRYHASCTDIFCAANQRSS